MTLDELRDAWNNDSTIDNNDLATAAAITPNLHAKYLGELINYRLKITKLQNEMIEYRSRRTKYYRGEMTKSELDDNGWEQWQLRTLKSEVDNLIEADSEYQKMVVREAYVKTVIFFLESVLGEIRSRSFHVKNVIEWHKFRAGA